MTRLIQNEVVKLLKTPMSYLLLIVTCVIVTVYSILLYSSFKEEDNYDKDWKITLKGEIDTMKENASDPTIESQFVAELKARIMVGEYKLDHNIPPSDWRNYVVPLYIEARELGNVEEAEKYLSIINTDDWKSMCKIQDQNTKTNLSNYKENTYAYKTFQLDLLLNEMRYQYDIKPTYKPEWKNDTLLKYIKNCEDLLHEESFYASENDRLSTVGVEEIKNENQLLLYKIKHNVADIPEKSLGNLYFNSFQIGIIIVLAAIIIICYLITSEYSLGTLSKLLSYPYKRWKILTAKLVVSILFTIVITIVFVSTALVVGSVLFGFSDIPSYLTVQNGSVIELNYYIYLLLKAVCILFETIIYISIGLCLSIWFENIGVSMGISLTLALASPWIITYLSQNLEFKWLKYIPMASFDMSQFLENKYVTAGLSLGYSSLVSVIVIAFVTWLGYHQFLREDV